MKSDNEIIAEFMGLERSKEIWENNEYAYTMKYSEVWNKWVIPSKMKYDISWDWLMPVVEKIEDVEVVKGRINRTAANVQIFYKACFIEYSPDEDSGDENGEFKIQTKGESKIESVYKAVVEFIKWYNSNKES